MDFLLECIGFPPDTDQEALVRTVLADGEGVPWRGDPARHRRLVVGEGIELRLDQEAGQDFWTLLPHYSVPHRLRVAVESIVPVEDSPFDALLRGWAAPPAPDETTHGKRGPGAYRLATWLCDARRLPRDLTPGHVLAVSVAGFAVHVEEVLGAAGARDPSLLELERGCRIEPLEGSDHPAGCCSISARVRSVLTVRNRLSGCDVKLVVADAPERPLVLFLSPWQLAQDGLAAPQPGQRIQGVFLFSGRIAGGLAGPRRLVGRDFG